MAEIGAAAPHPPSGQVRRHWFRCGPDLVFGDEDTLTPVFDPATAETHFLNDLPLLLLSAIGSEPRGFDALVADLAGDDIDDHARGRLYATLLQLEQAELVESVLRAPRKD